MADEPIELLDSKARILRLRKLNILQQTRLLLAVGKDNSENQPYMQVVNMTAMVSHIDGVPMPPMTNMRQVESAIGMLDTEGYAALQVYMLAEIKRITDEAEAAAEASGVEAGEAADPLHALGS